MKKTVITLSAVVVILITAIIILINDLYLRKTFYDRIHVEYDFNCIETEELAKNVADMICKSVYPDLDFDQYGIDIAYSEEYEEWIVFYYLLDDQGNPANVFGGGGPELCIKKKTGEITSLALQM